jgi:hypothetical protein
LFGAPKQPAISHEAYTLFSIVLLSLGGVATSWSGYQAPRWSGVQATQYSRASALRIESAVASSGARFQSDGSPEEEAAARNLQAARAQSVPGWDGWKPCMSDDKVIPFRKRPPSEAEIERYRLMTRGWHPNVRQLIAPQHFERDESRKRGSD